MPNKRFYKKWWFWVLFLVFVIVVLGIIFRPKEKISYVTETTQLQQLEQTVDASGEVESISEVDLAFDVSGELAEVLVKVDEFVEVGTLLAKLDTTELQADVQSAYQAVQYAKANLEKQRAGSTEEAVAISKAAADSAGATLEGARIGLSNAEVLLSVTKDRYSAEIETKQAALQTAQDNLTQTKKDNEQSKNEAYKDLLSATWAAAIEVRKSVSQADEVLGIRDSLANDDFQSGLSARNLSALTNATTAFYTAETSRDKAESALLYLSYSSANTSIAYASELAEKAVLDSVKLLLYTKQVADATLQTSDYTISELITLRASIDSARNALQVDQATLENAFQTLQSTNLSVDENYTDALNAYNQAKKNLSLTEATADQQITSAENSFASSKTTLAVRQADAEQAQASLSQTKAAPRSVDLASYQAEVERTKAANQAALARLEKAEIRSPIAGNVTEITSDIGEHIVGSTPIVTVQTTTEQFQVVSDISESDIVKVEVGDVAEITFDAYSDDFVLEGFIGEIDPAEKLIEGVVYYEATIYFESSEITANLRPGLSADIVLSTESREAVISIPQRAVKQKDNGKYVRVLTNSGPEERQITTGLLADMGRVEITSGLSENEEVIIREIHE